MPGRRITGGSAARSSATNAGSGPSSSIRSEWSFSAPRLQVAKTVKTSAATVSGNQPPCAILVMLAPRKAKSTVKKTTAPRPTSQPGLRQRTRTTTRKSRVSAVIVPVTAIP